MIAEPLLDDPVPCLGEASGSPCVRTLAPWEAGPYRVTDVFADLSSPRSLTLLDLMRILQASAFVKLGQWFEILRRNPQSLSSDLLSDGLRDMARAFLEAHVLECDRLGLACTAKLAERMKDELSQEGMTHEQMSVRASELMSRFNDESDAVLLIHISTALAKYWRDEQLFGAEVAERFPGAIVDIEEAGRCLASHRATAVVFHLMRVMEVGLKELGFALGIPYAPSWESYLRQIKNNLERDWKDKEPDWKANEPFFRQASSYLESIKIAWRNPTMHVIFNYTPDQAEEIFGAVRSFMRHLAENLPSPQPRETPAAPGG